MQQAGSWETAFNPTLTIFFYAPKSLLECFFFLGTIETIIGIGIEIVIVMGIEMGIVMCARME